MHSNTGFSHHAFPPGTYQIEDLDLSGQAKDVKLQPEPSSDPNDPLNWPEWWKHLNFTLVNYYVLMVFAFIDAATVTWGPMNEQLGFSYDILNDSYAAGCGTLCIGGVFLIPFALKFGRRPVYIISTVIQLAVSVWSAKLQTIVDLMLVNVFNCFIGALAEVMVQMSVADMYFVHQRGLMNTVYYWVMMTGSSLAPLAGGYITLSQGWRWIWWWMAILFGVGLVAFVFLYEETMYPRPAAPLTDGLEVDIHEPPGSNAFSTKNLKDSKPIDTKTATATLSQPTVVESSVNYDHYIPPRKSYWQIIAPWTVSDVPFDQLIKHMYEPFIIMFTFPAVFFMALEYGLLMACSNLKVTTLSSVMTLPPYNFGTAQIGLMGLPPFIGTSLASLICGPLSDSIALFLAKRRNGVYEPEMRLWLALAFALFVPAGMFMFGIGLQRGTHWILPALGMGVMSFGAVPASSSALTYLTDSYTEIVADSLIGVTFIRNLISTIMVFVQQPWIDSVGLDWFYITFGLIVTVSLLSNLIFIYFGKAFRVKLAGRYRSFIKDKA